MKKYIKYILFILVILGIKWTVSYFTGMEFRWWITLGIGIGTLLGYQLIESKLEH